MSMNFQIFPTCSYIPNTEEVINKSKEMLIEYFKDNNIEKMIDVKSEIFNISGSIGEIDYSNKLITSEKEQIAFVIENEGHANLFYHVLTDLDRDFWKEEILSNQKAQELAKDINVNNEVGYYWSVKRSAGQPPIINLLYGYLAISIADLTNGLIYSDDGAWEYSVFPCKAEAFKKIYLKLDNVKNMKLKQFIEQSLNKLKNG